MLQAFSQLGMSCTFASQLMCTGQPILAHSYGIVLGCLAALSLYRRKQQASAPQAEGACACSLARAEAVSRPSDSAQWPE